MSHHRKSDSKEYRAWQRMKNACSNQNVSSFRKYGAKGVRVCNEWLYDFNKFYADMGEMAAVSTGVYLIDETKDFCKINCQWGTSNRGRPAIGKTPLRKMKTKKSIANGRSVCIVLSGSLLNYIKSQAMHKSLEIGSYVPPNDLIRDALARAFPLPSQMDMFGGKI